MRPFLGCRDNAKHLALLLLCCVALPTLAEPPRTFAEAKDRLVALCPAVGGFYCGCRYNGNRVDLKSCGYQPRKNPQRAARIEWEHLVLPAWVIGHQRRCWQQGGRKQCARSDETFRRAEVDLFNLVPSIGEINGDRSNLSFAWLPQPPTQYGACPMVVDFKAGKAMPRPKVRGMIAHFYFYMSQRYGLRLSKRSAACSKPGAGTTRWNPGSASAASASPASWAGVTLSSALSICAAAPGHLPEKGKND